MPLPFATTEAHQPVRRAGITWSVMLWAMAALAPAGAEERQPDWPVTTVTLARPVLRIEAPLLPTAMAWTRMESPADDVDLTRAGEEMASVPLLRGDHGFQLRVAQAPLGVRVLLQSDAARVERTGYWLRLRISADATLALPRAGWWGPDFEPVLVETPADCDRQTAADHSACRAWEHRSIAQRRGVLHLFRQESVWINSGGAQPPMRAEMGAVLGRGVPMPTPQAGLRSAHRKSPDAVTIGWFLPWDSLPLTQQLPLAQLLLAVDLCRSENDCESLLPVSRAAPDDAVLIRLDPVRPYRISACDVPLLGLHRSQGQWLAAAYYPQQSAQVDTVYTWGIPASDLRSGVRGLAPTPQLWDWTHHAIRLGPDEYLCGPRLAWRRDKLRLLGGMPAQAGAVEPGEMLETPQLQAAALATAASAQRYWLALEPPEPWLHRYGIGAQAGDPGVRAALWLLDRQSPSLHRLWTHRSAPADALEVKVSNDLRRIEVEHWEDGVPRPREQLCLVDAALPLRQCTAEDTSGH